MAEITDDLIHSLWGVIDGWVGTGGKTTDLYVAVNTYNWNRILLTEGATLSQALTISTAGTFIVSPYALGELSLGQPGISITANNVRLAGFHIEAPTGVGITIGGSAVGANLERVSVNDAFTHGLHITTTGNDHVVRNCEFTNSNVSGIKIQSGASGVRVLGSMCYGNQAYGIDDQSNSSMIVGCRLDGNVSGAINGTPAGDAGNKKT